MLVNRLIWFLYRLVLGGARLALPLAAVFVPRIRTFLRERQAASATVFPVVPTGRPVIWMHCASLGEFEQGRPVWEALARDHSDAFFVLTFFSPSGYTRQKLNPEASLVTYLPLDGPRTARRFVTTLKPSLVLWVKYDFWFYYWRVLRQQQIPVALIGARFHADHFLGRRWARPFRDLVAGSALLAVQDAESADRARSWGASRVLQAGDPRVDRVIRLPDENLSDEVLDRWLEGGGPILVAGSVWPRDLSLLQAAGEELSGWRWIIVPHQVDPLAVDQLLVSWPLSSVRYSQPETVSPAASCLVLDTIGLLNRVYRYADMVYVGGGLGRSVHNLLEPAVYGVPVVYGPRHDKFPEGRQLALAGGGFPVQNPDELRTVWTRFREPEARRQAGLAARKVIEQQAGATARILDQLNQLLLDKL